MSSTDPSARLADIIDRANRMIVPTIVHRFKSFLQTKEPDSLPITFDKIIYNTFDCLAYKAVIRWLSSPKIPWTKTPDWPLYELLLPRESKLKINDTLTNLEHLKAAAAIERTCSRTTSSIAMINGMMPRAHIPEQSWIDEHFGAGNSVFATAKSFECVAGWVEDTANGGSVNT